MKTLKLKKVLLFCLMALTCMSSWSQEFWKFGNKYAALVASPTTPLLERMQKEKSLNSLNFVSKVGGVAFLAEAEPNDTIKNENIKIAYNVNKPDGYRLEITIGEKTLSPYLPDWQLIPIVKYVNSDYNACVSLFGENGNNSSYEITYHPAFNNTLLGIRLLQADIALMDLSVNWQLPTFNSNQILGEGESIKNKNSWQEDAMKIQNLTHAGNFSAWVLTDDDTRVVFNIQNNTFSMTGTPYYHFWRYGAGLREKQAKRNNLVSEYNAQVKLYNTGRGNQAQIEQNLKKIKQEMEELDKSIDKEVTADYATINKLKNKYDLLEQYNPCVYSAIKNVMQYSAFFRYVKKKDPTNWDTFYNRCSSVHIKPVVKTPTRFPKK
ncbi:MAG: hypothetical protein FWC39_03305 [Bacteroidetes bacterium]|nr:hypothetical protein [Bacteroidota bacterium]